MRKLCFINDREIDELLITASVIVLPVTKNKPAIALSE